MSPEQKNALSRAIDEASGTTFEIAHSRPVGGGCIHRAYLISGNDRRYFVKINAARAADMFAAEADALRALAQTRAITVPEPLTDGSSGELAYLVLEAVDFGPSGDWAQMGRELAALHRHTSDSFGWHRDNYIGETPQPNSRTREWPVFFREQRLRPQLALAARNGYRFPGQKKLLDAVDSLLAAHVPEASLLHGDLWAGNAGFSTSARPVLYDPASYYGDRETDLAFTEFFGGFAPAFYHAYKAAWPLTPGYNQRKKLYNLYHILNHANLFGGGYVDQARSTMQELLKLR